MESNQALKSVFIAYNQAYHSLIIRILDRQSLRGYTSWNHVQGRGSDDGEPHLGSHAWPAMNNAMLVIVPAERLERLLEALRELDQKTPEQGLRAFVWNVEQSI